MAKKIFGGARSQIVGTLVAAIGGLALTACCGQCPGPAVYKKPCCAQSPCGAQACGSRCGAAPATAPSAPRPAAPQQNCGAGKCA